MSRPENPRTGESALLLSGRNGDEEVVQASEQKFRVASLAANLGLWSYDIATRVLSVDDNAERLFGVEAGSFGEHLSDFLDHVSESDRARVADSLRSALDGREHFFVEFHADWPDGRRRGLQARGSLVHDAAGVPRTVHGAVWDATDLLEAEQATRDSERRFRTALENAPSGMALADAGGRFTRVNQALCELLGYTELELLQQSFFEMLHHGDVASCREAIARMVVGEANSYRDEVRFYGLNGQLVWVSLSAAIVRGEPGEPVQFVLQTDDITERRRSRRAYEQAEQRFRSAFDEARVGMAIVDVRMEGHATLDRVNPALCDLTGRKKQELEGKGIDTIVHPQDLERLQASFSQLAHGGVTFSYEARALGPNGDPVPVAINACVMLAADRFRQVLLHVQDVTDRKRVESWLQHLADHDPLTGLFNRRRFSKELSRELSAARRYGTGGAVLTLDLDGFKYVNDSLGHASGDDLIVKVGRVLRARLRDSDTLARLGGDEFAVVLPHADEDQARLVGQQLIDAISRQATVSSPSGERKVTASVGVSMFHDDPDKRTGEQLLIEADIAMYDAKAAGRNQVVLFDPASARQAEMTERLCWVDRIREALEEERFVLHAQPIMPLEDDPRARHELLVRMLSPDGDLIHPPSFLEIAERFELIQEIDRWVVRKGIQLLADRQRKGDDVCFEINLSAKSICDPSLPGLIEAELLRTGADPSSLVFEVTETTAIVNVEQAKTFAQRISQLGCEFALDDFGAGFASFYYLKHLAFDYVKIDGEFIRDLPASEASQLVVKSVVDLARGLGKKTIAEFVQDEDTLRMLRQYGIDYAQGFHIGRPGPLKV